MDKRKEEEEAAQRKQDALLARRREVSLELDALWVVPFERRTAQEDARVGLVLSFKTEEEEEE